MRYRKGDTVRVSGTNGARFNEILENDIMMPDIDGMKYGATVWRMMPNDDLFLMVLVKRPIKNRVLQILAP